MLLRLRRVYTDLPAGAATTLLLSYEVQGGLHDAYEVLFTGTLVREMIIMS
jgi:hypothetical protein